jgi:ketosteroid isomerase-like protein
MQQINHSYKKICEEIAKGNLEFYEKYLANDVQWNIIGDVLINGKDKVIERAGMPELDAYPVITIKNIVAEENMVVVESTGEAALKNGQPYHQTYCDVYHFKDGKIIEFTTYLNTALSINSRQQ